MNFKIASFLYCFNIISACKSIWTVARCAIIASINGERTLTMTRKQGLTDYKLLFFISSNCDQMKASMVVLRQEVYL